MVSFSEITTLGVGGSIACFIECSPDEFVERAPGLFRPGHHVLVVGGGSNLVASDCPFPGTVVRLKSRDTIISDDGNYTRFSVSAGTSWDDLVSYTLDLGFDQLSPMSGIPGTFGGALAQNISAYGAAVRDVLGSVEVYDACTSEVVTFGLEDMRYGYRTSALKNVRNKVILGGTLLLKPGPTPVLHRQLANALKVDLGTYCSGKQVRDQVLRIRAEKGMLPRYLVPKGFDVCNTSSVGSFFVNPIVSKEHLSRLRRLVPQGALNSSVIQTDEMGGVKVSAAFLLEQSGFEKGFCISGSQAAISTQHSLAIVNRGGATAAEVIELAGLITRTVSRKFDIHLIPEPVFVGLEL
ncbi:UDP-N-acetylmuramate dehydrogenase [Tropheryma whipplei]|uniref:UDP-N-acetylmuramate dehydrogenase n=1 Tax=Tropheryma whipplei TaxID=2039 RepID=UPI0004B92FBA|nr:UDP-N-acetylmuramate dehydrogenase [Tropheryma whipplei]MCO8190312.1 UDP-N-acetylmuramate dehydrogenase [Tropheryma whipplei]